MEGHAYFYQYDSENDHSIMQISPSIFPSQANQPLDTNENDREATIESTSTRDIHLRRSNLRRSRVLRPKKRQCIPSDVASQPEMFRVEHSLEQIFTADEKRKRLKEVK